MKRSAIWLMAGVVLFLGISIFVDWLDFRVNCDSVSSTRNSDPSFDNPLDLVFALGNFGAFLVGILVVAFRKMRTAGVFLVACSLAYMGGCASRHFIFGDPRKEAFTRLGERMTPLVNAIETYHRDNGAYPSDLKILVPTYLSHLPSTEMCKYTNYYYYVGETARGYHGNPWAIRIPAGFGLGFDEFLYFPLQNYPGPPYERLGKWAYCHD